MNFLLAAVGRSRPGPERTLYDHYRARLGWRLDLREVEEKRPLPVEERKTREAQLLSACVPKGAVTLVLDERGKSLSSQDFAKLIGQWRDQARSDVAILIGGADGHAATLKSSADLLLSLGPMTWPHMLVRGLIAEQLYRAECILANHPYHRS